MHLVLEFFRSDQADDPFAFRAGCQEYVRRTDGGGAELATLDWDAELLFQLAALRLPGRAPELVQRLGERLQRFMAPTGWAASEAELLAAVERAESIFITLRLGAAELYSLPWELLTLKATGQHLGELPGVLLRYAWPATQTTPERPQPRPAGGRILFGWSAALGAVPAAEHQQALAQACRVGSHAFDAERDVLPHLSCTKLTAALELAARDSGADSAIAVLHILCHGARNGEGFGLGWDGDEAGACVVVDAGRLRQLLFPYAHMIRLVVLCACDSADMGQLGNHLGSVAQALHRAGIEAVVASRFPLSAAGSATMAREFYGSLLAPPASVQSAFLAARRALAQDAVSLDWAGLQLYARPEDGDDSRPVVFRPYRSLLAFQPKHARFFFGRDAAQHEVLADLRALRESGRPRFLVVAGASGTGKSSVVLAGVVPQLLGQAGVAGAAAGSRPWEVAVLRPGSDPLGALQAALATRREPGAPFLLVVDQFEEIFTHEKDPAVRQEFARRLWSLCKQESAVECIVTLRVDFLGQCGELILDESGICLDRVAYDESHRVFVAQMELAQLRAAIEEPARRVGLQLQEGLAQQLLAEVGNEPGALPLLSDVLDLLWQRRRQRLLSSDSYAELGGLSGALKVRADSVIDGLNPGQQCLARNLLLRLVSLPQGGGVPTRRRVLLSELVARTGEHDKDGFDAVLQGLVEARLLVRSETDGKVMVEVAHEALIRKWDRLQQWLRADYERLIETRELEPWLAQWREQGVLLSGARLGYASRVLQKHAGELDSELISLVHASERAARWNRLKLAVLVATVIGALSTLSLFAFTEKSKAQAQERVSLSRYLGGQAKHLLEARADGLLGERPSHAILLSVLAHRLHNEEQSRSVLFEMLERNRAVRVFLYGPRGPVKGVALRADGKLLGAGGADGRLWLFDIEKGGDKRPAGEPIADAGLLSEISAMAMSQDGQILAAGNTKGRILLVDVPTRKRLAELQQKDSTPIYSLDFAPDGKLLASSGDDGSIALWDVAARALTQPPLAGDARDIVAVRFAPAGARLAAGGDDGSIAIWDVGSRRPVYDPRHGHREYVSSVAWSPDGDLLASGSADRSLLLWDAKAGGPLGSPLYKHGKSVTDILFSPDGKLAFSSGWDGVVWTWDVHDHKAVGQPLIGHAGRIYALALDAAGRTLVSGGDDELVVWELAAHGPVHQQLARYRVAVSSMAMSPDGALIMAGAPDGTITFWDVKSEQAISAPQQGHKDAVNAVAISPDGKLAASGSSDQSVVLWELGQRRRTAVLPSRHGGSVLSAAFSTDGRFLATGGVDGAVVLWDVAARQPRGGIPRLDGRQEAVTSVSFSPDGKLLASGGFDGGILLWDIASGDRACARLLGHRNSVTDLGFSPDGKLLTSAGSDGSVFLWPMVACPVKPQASLLHKGGVTALRFSPDGTILAVAGQDARISLWDVAHGQPLGLPLQGHLSAITGLAFGPRGLLASADGQGLWLWDLSEDSAEARACSRAGTNLGLLEWRHYVGSRPYCRICAAWPAGEGAPASAPLCTR